MLDRAAAQEEAMAEPLAETPSPAPALNDEKTLPVIIYVLYLVGMMNGLTTLIGFVMAYVLKGDCGERACSHYIFQIRTVWIALAWALIGGLFMLIGLPLTLVLIGFLFLKLAAVIFGLLALWFVIRSVTGLIYIAKGEAHPRPRTWFF
jgi:uncharacterized membrane protein